MLLQFWFDIRPGFHYKCFGSWSGTGCNTMPNRNHVTACWSNTRGKTCSCGRVVAEGGSFFSRWFSQARRSEPTPTRATHWCWFTSPKGRWCHLIKPYFHGDVMANSITDISDVGICLDLRKLVGFLDEPGWTRYVSSSATIWIPMYQVWAK